jgi:hypothetical protein
MKTRALVRRTARAEVTPTRIEAEELARRQEEEALDDDKLDFHARQERARQKYLSQFPDGYDPLERSLDAYADALAKPREPVKYDPIPDDDKGEAMTAALERFKTKIEGPKPAPDKTKH